jgi:disulfide bond formation protein DsbB
MFLALNRFFNSQVYWAILFLVGLGFEGTALYFQYGLEYGPCPLCIHTRIGVMAFMLVAMIALLGGSMAWWRLAHIANLAVFGWLSERAYLLLGTERGFVFLECGVDPGLPTWLPLDKWLPFMFEVKESCGYTPKLWFDVSMAEALMLVFPVLGVISLLGLILSFLRPKI